MKSTDGRWFPSKLSMLPLRYYKSNVWCYCFLQLKSHCHCAREVASDCASVKLDLYFRRQIIENLREKSTKMLLYSLYKTRCHYLEENSRPFIIQAPPITRNELSVNTQASGSLWRQLLWLEAHHRMKASLPIWLQKHFLLSSDLSKQIIISHRKVQFTRIKIKNTNWMVLRRRGTTKTKRCENDKETRFVCLFQRPCTMSILPYKISGGQ
jgi:hypothetical protein